MGVIQGFKDALERVKEKGEVKLDMATFTEEALRSLVLESPEGQIRASGLDALIQIKVDESYNSGYEDGYENAQNEAEETMRIRKEHTKEHDVSLKDFVNLTNWLRKMITAYQFVKDALVNAYTDHMGLDPSDNEKWEEVMVCMLSAMEDLPDIVPPVPAAFTNGESLFVDLDGMHESCADEVRVNDPFDKPIMPAIGPDDTGQFCVNDEQGGDDEKQEAEAQGEAEAATAK